MTPRGLKREQVRRASVNGAVGKYVSFTLLLKLLFSVVWPLACKTNLRVPIPDWFWPINGFYLMLSSLLVGFLLRRIGLSEIQKRGDKDIVLSNRDTSLEKQFLDWLTGSHQILKNSLHSHAHCRAILATDSLISLTLIAISVCVLLAGLCGSTIHFGVLPENILVAGPVALVTLLTISFWRLKKEFADKWRFCTETYYSLGHDNKPDEVNLALEILRLDLWAKRGFVEFFGEHLREAVEWKRLIDPRNARRLSNRIRGGELTEEEAETLLLEYRTYVGAPLSSEVGRHVIDALSKSKLVPADLAIKLRGGIEASQLNTEARFLIEALKKDELLTCEQAKKASNFLLTEPLGPTSGRVTKLVIKQKAQR